MNAGLNHSVRRGGGSPFLASLIGSTVAALLPACGSSGGGSDDGGTGWPKGNVVLSNANNYTSDTSLNIPIVETAPMADLTVCWDGLMKDLLCHDLVPMTDDIDNVGFLQIPNMSKTAVQDKLAVGQLDENLVKIYRDHHVDSATTCANLSTFMLGATLLNPTADYVADATKTYMLLFATGITPGVGSRSMMFLQPTAGSTVTTVDAIDACMAGVLTFNATLGQPMPISATDNTMWHVDWSQITHDSFQNPVTFSKLDSVQIGFYQDKTAADLQMNFKDIELIATTLYTVAVPGGARDVDLANAKLQDGTTPFPGFTQTNGTWALAVRCSRCQIPAPVVMTILQPN